jgi:hypothetical protein
MKWRNGAKVCHQVLLEEKKLFNVLQLMPQRYKDDAPTQRALSS